MRIAIAASLLVALAATPAHAQDVNAEPNYQTVFLTNNFTPDPYTIAVDSGGEIDANTIADGCYGYIANAPDVRLVFEVDPTVLYPLIISVDAAEDTTLVVNAPDGLWYCDDDSGENGLNPMVRLNKPMSGRYEIWIGTYGSTDYFPATLHLSELYSQ